MRENEEDRKALAIMAHDIKAPLSAIVDILDVIKRGYVTDIEKTRELISRATQKAETLINMVDDILDYTLLTDKSKMKIEEIEIYNVLLESIGTMKPYAVQNGITLEYHPKSCEEKYVNGNYTFLLRVFNNIIMNAIKYNKENGQITIDCHTENSEKEITIRIKDTGIGIPGKEMEKVFHIFERGSRARRNIDGSLGLGLSLVKQIIEDHDGHIDLKSTVNVGTTVSISLPLIPLNMKKEAKK